MRWSLLSTAIVAEWKMPRARRHVLSPSGWSHSAGAESIWEVSRVTLSGFESVVKRDAEVEYNLH